MIFPSDLRMGMVLSRRTARGNNRIYLRQHQQSPYTRPHIKVIRLIRLNCDLQLIHDKATEAFFIERGKTLLPVTDDSFKKSK